MGLGVTKAANSSIGKNICYTGSLVYLICIIGQLKPSCMLVGSAALETFQICCDTLYFKALHLILGFSSLYLNYVLQRFFHCMAINSSFYSPYLTL
jgi:hypothetical protein